MAARNATLIHAPKKRDGEEQDTAPLARPLACSLLRGGKASKEDEGGEEEVREKER